MDHLAQENRPGDPFADEVAGTPPFFDDRPDALRQGEKFVVFSLNEKLYAVPSVDIAEVIHLLPVTPLPMAPDAVLGLTNLRGEILAVLSLKRMWNEDNSAPSERAKLVVLRSEDPASRFAFEVDKLSEIVAIPDSAIEPAKEKAAPHVYGTVTRGPAVLNLVDVRRLIASLSLA
jgi:purine-binding chemotaxis protein CheW